MRKCQIPANLLHKILHLTSHKRFNEAIKELTTMQFQDSVGLEIAHAVSELAIRSTPTYKRPNKKGILLVVTGIDKTGKETQCFNPHKLQNIVPITSYLAAKGFDVIGIKQPAYESKTGQLIRALLGKKESCSIIGELPIETSWVLWTLNRVLANNIIEYWLREKNHAVVAKRWSESNIVYHKVLGAPLDLIVELERSFVQPDIIVVLDAHPKVSLARAGKARDTFENEKFLLKVREEYLNLHKYYPSSKIIIVDASKPITHVNKIILENLEHYLQVNLS